MTAEAFAKLISARLAGTRGWIANCPAPPHRLPSLSIGEGRDGRVLIYCHAGCAISAIPDVTGLKMADLGDGPSPTPQQARQIVQERAGTDAETQSRHSALGVVCARLRRLEPGCDSFDARLAGRLDDRVLAGLFPRHWTGCVRLRRRKSC